MATHAMDTTIPTAASLRDQQSENVAGQTARLEISSEESTTHQTLKQTVVDVQQPLLASGQLSDNTMPQFEAVETRRAPAEVREYAAKKFYCTRPGAFQHAVEDVKQYIEPSLDGNFKGAWLLTEIDHWDHEKERLVIMTDYQLLVIKYDFVALRINDCRRISLKTIQKVQSGGFVFPERSMRPERSYQTGIRIHIDKTRVLTKWQRWSPFFKDIPYITFHQHKVATLLDELSPELIYEDFKHVLIHTLTDLGTSFETALEPIDLEIYIGALSSIHNSSDLGFSKDRGAASF